MSRIVFSTNQTSAGVPALVALTVDIETSAKSLKRAVSMGLVPHDFVPKEALPDIGGKALEAVWVKKSFNINRAVVLARTAEGHSLESLFRARLAVGKALGRIPVLYGIGIQLVLSGRGITDARIELSDFVDRIDNQRSIVQSVHLVDESVFERRSVRTWGQTVTAKFQDALEASIDAYLRGCERSARESKSTDSGARR